MAHAACLYPPAPATPAAAAQAQRAARGKVIGTRQARCLAAVPSALLIRPCQALCETGRCKRGRSLRASAHQGEDGVYTYVLTQMLPRRSSGPAICTTPHTAAPMTQPHGTGGSKGRSEEEGQKKAFLPWSRVLDWPHHSGSGYRCSSLQPSRECVSRQAVPVSTAARV